MRKHVSLGCMYSLPRGSTPMQRPQGLTVVRALTLGKHTFPSSMILQCSELSSPFSLSPPRNAGGWGGKPHSSLLLLAMGRATQIWGKGLVLWREGHVPEPWPRGQQGSPWILEVFSMVSCELVITTGDKLEVLAWGQYHPLGSRAWEGRKFVRWRGAGSCAPWHAGWMQIGHFCSVEQAKNILAQTR